MASKKPVIHGRDHRPIGWNGPDDRGGADPLPFLASLAVNLPYAFAGGETRTDVADSTRTAVLMTTGVVSDNGGDFFDVTNVATTGVISVLEQGLYFCIGNIIWAETWTALTVLKWHVSLSSQFDDIGGARSGSTLAGSAAGSLVYAAGSDGQYQQAITLINRPGTAPWDFYMTAYQESGSTRQTLDAGAGIVRIGNSSTLD